MADLPGHCNLFRNRFGYFLSLCASQHIPRRSPRQPNQERKPELQHHEITERSGRYHAPDQKEDGYRGNGASGPAQAFPFTASLAGAAQSLDVPALAKRFGPDQPCLDWDLLNIIYCGECRSAGRDDRNLQFTNHANDTRAAEGLDAVPLRPKGLLHRRLHIRSRRRRPERPAGWRRPASVGPGRRGLGNRILHRLEICASAEMIGTHALVVSQNRGPAPPASWRRIERPDSSAGGVGLNRRA